MTNAKICNRGLLGHYINGQQLSLREERTLEVCSPLDGDVLASMSLANAGIIDQAVKAAEDAFALWSEVPIKQRVQVLYKFKQLVESRIDELSEVVSSENGKTLDEAKAEIERGIEVVEFAASIPNLGLDANLEVSKGVDCHIRRFPLGVVAGITPFNFPAMVPMWMFPLAIACGNSFLLKPSEQTPLAPHHLGRLLHEAGLPKGVYNVINGDRVAVEAILDHPEIRAVGFVGSTNVADFVYQRGIGQGKQVLALGGAKNHLILMPDADPDIAAANIVASAMGCAGQRCMAASVLIVVGNCESIVDRIVEIASGIRSGINLGAVISKTAKARINGYIDQAEKEGARLLLDGRHVSVPQKEGGAYVNPTIIDGITEQSACVQDEIFGPVLSILRVGTIEEALAIENANPYGNAASIYTTSGATSRYFSQRASAGMIGVNIGVPVPRDPFPFGGWNSSKFGVGDITGVEGVRFWTKAKKITQKWGMSASQDWMS